MADLALKLRNRARRHNRVRARVQGTAARPRLAVHISNQHIRAQVIDDTTGKTLAAASTVTIKEGQTKTEKAAAVGTAVATAAKAAKVSKVVLDRGSRLYHGRVKALADAARAAGLEF